MRVHFIAIGGSIMHSLALALKSLGHEVTGSDDEIYEPARSRLQHEGLLPDQTGWFPERIIEGLDLVVLGMHARADNPELAQALASGIPVKSFPELMFELSRDKMRIVVAGSHGKTTTSGMIAHVLNEAGLEADRMIGARIGDLEPVTVTEAGIIVLEGDEYLSSPLDPRAKFLHYHPQVAIITGIAWDHMNVFPTYASYVEPFRQFIQSLGENDTLIFCEEDADLVELVHDLEPICTCIPYREHPYVVEEGKVMIRDAQNRVYELGIFGRHNLQNLMAAKLALSCTGMGETQFYEGITSFTGAHKRLQLLHKGPNRTTYLDFAHAPSKVRATVEAVREKHPKATIIACLELHTFSSLNPDFLPQYKGSLVLADHKIVYFSPHTLEIKKLPDLSSDQLTMHFNEPKLQVATSSQELEKLIRQIQPDGEVVLLWMSSGRFDGLDVSAISKEI